MVELIGLLSILLIVSCFFLPEVFLDYFLNLERSAVAGGGGFINIATACDLYLIDNVTISSEKRASEICR